MPSLSPSPIEDSEDEYRAIEATLLESARGRWFLVEHGRRARRLDSALLEDAISRLQNSLRQPPALLGQLHAEIQSLKSYVADVRADLMAKPGASDTSAPTHAIIKAAEDIHEIAWALQASPFDPKGCEEVARHAGKLYALSQSHAVESQRMLSVASALDEATHRLEAILETVLLELRADDPSH
jgi:hypothetical protein